MRLLSGAALLLPLLSACGGPGGDSIGRHTGASPRASTTDPSDRAIVRVAADERAVERVPLEMLMRPNIIFAPNAADCTPAAPATATSHTINLWPPNHTLHAISAADCVTVADDCDENASAELVWGSSDEPVNDIGDGNHEPDIVAACDGFQLRSERQGPRNGRVYHLGWRALDSGGNVLEGACTVIVDHDQSGAVSEDDGEAYRIELDPTECGETEPEPEPPSVPMCPDATNPDCL